MGRKRRTAFEVCQSIVEHSQHSQVVFEDGTKLRVDSFTAGAIVAVDKALNEDVRTRFRKQLGKSRAHFARLVGFCFQNVR